jgi:hypothetical protein
MYIWQQCIKIGCGRLIQYFSQFLTHSETSLPRCETHAAEKVSSHKPRNTLLPYTSVICSVMMSLDRNEVGHCCFWISRQSYIHATVLTLVLMKVCFRC